MGAIGGIGLIVGLIVMVMFHEYGHYVTAKRYGMKVTEFFFGFGPRIWSIRRGETDYGIKPIALGGYVKIVGMNPLEEIPPEEEPRTFRGKSPGQRLVVLAAGSTTHFISGAVLLMTAFCLIGQPHLAPEIGEVPVEQGTSSPAQIAGLAPGDRIVAIDGRPVRFWLEVMEFIRANPDRTVVFDIQRGGERIRKEVSLQNREGVGYLGVRISGATVAERLNPISGVKKTGEWFWNFGYGGVKGLVSFFTPGSLSKYFRLLTGTETRLEEQPRFLSPVGAVNVGTQTTGFFELFYLIAGINIFVGIFNLLPLFPLDGGWMAVILYEKIASAVRRRKVEVDYRRVVPMAYGVLAVLGFIFVTSLYLDITNPINLNQ